MRELTIQDLKNQVLNKKIDFWSPRRCSICNRRIGYIFGIDENGSARTAFDPHCDCVRYRVDNLFPCEFNEILNHYNQMDEKEKSDFVNYWGLNNENN